MRLARTVTGCATAAFAASKIPATALAWVAAVTARAAASFKNCVYLVATAVIAAAAGPCQGPPAKPAVTDPNESAAQPNS